MRKPKKDGKSLNCIIDRTVYETLEEYCNEVGQTKTLAVERILQRFFDSYYHIAEAERAGENAK